MPNEGCVFDPYIPGPFGQTGDVSDGASLPLYGGRGEEDLRATMLRLRWPMEEEEEVLGAVESSPSSREKLKRGKVGEFYFLTHFVRFRCEANEVLFLKKMPFPA